MADCIAILSPWLMLQLRWHTAEAFREHFSSWLYNGQQSNWSRWRLARVAINVGRCEFVIDIVFITKYTNVSIDMCDIILCRMFRMRLFFCYRFDFFKIQSLIYLKRNYLLPAMGTVSLLVSIKNNKHRNALINFRLNKINVRLCILVNHVTITSW